MNFLALLGHDVTLVALVAVNVVALGLWLASHRLRFVVRSRARRGAIDRAVTASSRAVTRDLPRAAAAAPVGQAGPAARTDHDTLTAELRRWQRRVDSRRTDELRRAGGARLPHGGVTA